MGMGVKIPWVGGSIYHVYGGRYTMGREVNMPWVGSRYTMVRGVDIPWVGRSIYHG
jgi:hypothetical protein